MWGREFRQITLGYSLKKELREFQRLVDYFIEIRYSSPPQLHYPQLRYFCSYAILNWVQKNSSYAIFCEK